MNNENEYTFCPQCGKILVHEKRGFFCPKCRRTVKEIKKSGLISEENDDILYEKPSLKNVSDDFNQIDRGSWEKYFPYIKIRPLQEEIIQAISKNDKKNSHIIIQAANGVGKTISVLSSILPINWKKKKKIIYSCRTHQQMSRVITELKMIRQLTPISGVALRGRRDLCLHPILTKYAIDAQNASDICRYLKKEGKCKYFSRLSKTDVMKRVEKDTKGKVLDSLELIKIGKKHEVCPTEISLKLLKNASVITASYQYIFNPFIRSAFLGNLEKELDDCILIIDEAHNLPSTAVDISSMSLSEFSIENAENEARKHNMDAVYSILEALSFVLKNESFSLPIDEEKKVDAKDLFHKIEQRAQEKVDQEIIELLLKFGEDIKQELIKRNRAPMSYLSAVGKYLKKLFDTKNSKEFAHFIIKTLSKTGNPIVKLQTLSLDPRSVTKEIFDQIYLSVSISGTLDPISAYISLIGLEKQNVTSLNLPSPYQKENHITLVVDKVSSKLEDRIPATYDKMIDIIEGVEKATPKNVGIFCASYSVMNSLLKAGLENRLSKPLFVAQQGMSSIENDELILEFKNESKNSGGVLISVLGGRSSEGSDYPAGEMQSVIIVGIPYARPSSTINASIEYLDSQFPTKGREFGYNIPALTRASQAAGRPIRSLEDYAAIILLDYRFARHYYKKHLPNWLKENMHIVQPTKENIQKRVKKFYNYHS